VTPGSADPIFSVSQAADMLGVRPAFMRRLDTEGVVVPQRSDGGQRRYSVVDINHAAALYALMGDGMTLAGAQRIIELENEVAELRRRLARRDTRSGAT
jgi:MerR family transcriptional regulator/heat shock protein HspR